MYGTGLIWCMGRRPGNDLKVVTMETKAISEALKYTGEDQLTATGDCQYPN